MVMGLAGLALAWRRAGGALAFAPVVADALAWAAAAVWLVLAAFAALVVVRHRERLAAWYADPALAPFPSLAGVSLMVAAVALAPHGAWARAAYVAGLVLTAIALIAFTIAMARRRPPNAAITSAWYLPGVAGGLVGTIGAGAFDLRGLAVVGIGVALAGWLAVAPRLLLRAWRGGAHAPVTPVAAIELAPPAVGGLAWFAVRPGAPDGVAMVLFVGAAIAALLLLPQIPRMRGTPVGPAWWAFSFPLAAWASLALAWRARAPLSGPAAVALPLLAVASAVIAALAADTLVKLASRRLLAPPPAPIAPRV